MRGTVAKRLRREAARQVIEDTDEEGESVKKVLMGRISKYVKDLKGGVHPRVTAFYPPGHYRRIYQELKKSYLQSKSRT